jgi:hypothetical protein
MTVTSAPRPTDTRPRPADNRPGPAVTRGRTRRIEEVIGPIASWLAAHSVTAAADASAGTDSGTTSRQNTCQWLAPSTATFPGAPCCSSSRTWPCSRVQG